MSEQDFLESARYISTTGRMIHDRIQRVTTGEYIRMAEGRLGDLSAPQINMIVIINAREAVSVSELAAHLGVSPPSVSAMVDRLVERGLLTRTPCRQDRRKVVIQVSPEARKDIARVQEKVLASFMELVKAIGPETTKKWCEVLREISKVLNDN